jgi:hypothetical protein
MTIEPQIIGLMNEQEKIIWMERAVT